MQVVVRLPVLISEVDERRDTQAPMSSEPSRSQRRKKNMKDFLRGISDELEKETEDSVGGILECDDESFGGKRKGKDPVRFPPEEIASEKVGEEQTAFVVRNFLWESRFRASVSDTKRKGVVSFSADDVADDEEIVSITDSELREDEDEEGNIWEALKPGIQEQLRNVDYETHKEFLKRWNEAEEAYKMNSEIPYRKTPKWIYRGVVIA